MLLPIISLGLIMASCNKQEGTLQVENGCKTKLTIMATNNLSTKISVNDLQLSWSANDEIGLIHSNNGSPVLETFKIVKQTGQFTNNESFSGEVNNWTSGEKTFYCIYPLTGGIDKFKAGEQDKYTFSIPTMQTQINSSAEIIDNNSLGAYEILVAKASTSYADRNTMSINFAHVNTLLDFVISDIPSATTIYSLSLRCDLPIFPQQAEYNFATGVLTPTESNKSTSFTVNLKTGDKDGITVNNGQLTVRLSMLPFTISDNRRLYIDLVTTKAQTLSEVSEPKNTRAAKGYIITKEIDGMDTELAFTKGKRKKILLNLKNESICAMYGICGKSIIVNGIEWAPVNCGYEPANGTYKGYIYGKLYQWGRKDGQGYDSNDASDAIVTSSTATAGSPLKNPLASTFYSSTTEPYDWYAVITADQYNNFWNSSFSSNGDLNPTKSKYDPCPDGWRVPTKTEMSKLENSTVSRVTNFTHGISPNIPYGYLIANALYFPQAGRRINDGSVPTVVDYMTTVKERYSIDFGNVYLWASTPDGTNATMVKIFNTKYVDNTYYVTNDKRACAFSVRCVRM